MSAITGGRELQAFLNLVPAKVERNIMRGALRQGANVIKEEAQRLLAENGSIETGLTKKGLKVSTKARGGKVTASMQAKGSHAYIAHWLEYGVKPHSVKKGAKRLSGNYLDGKLHPGFEPKPFMRPALDSQQGAALVAVSKYVRARLTKHGINTPDINLEFAE